MVVHHSAPSRPQFCASRPPALLPTMRLLWLFMFYQAMRCNCPASRRRILPCSDGHLASQRRQAYRQCTPLWPLLIAYSWAGACWASVITLQWTTSINTSCNRPPSSPSRSTTLLGTATATRGACSPYPDEVGVWQRRQLLILCPALCRRSSFSTCLPDNVPSFIRAVLLAHGALHQVHGEHKQP